MGTLWKRTNARPEHVETGNGETVLQEKRVKSQGDAGPGREGVYSVSQAELTRGTVLLQVGIFCSL